MTRNNEHDWYMNFRMFPRIILLSSLLMGCEEEEIVVEGEIPKPVVEKFVPPQMPNAGLVLSKEMPLHECLQVLPSCQCQSSQGEGISKCTAQFVSEILELSSDLQNRIQENIWQSDCPIPLEKLRLLRVLHWTDKDTVEWGELILAERVVKDAVLVFQELYNSHFVFHSLKPAYYYKGDNDESMRDNNTSSFNCRKATTGADWSEPSYGEAINVNPLWNPWVKGNSVYPKEGSVFQNRAQKIPGMINEGDGIIDIFKKYGWGWGSSKSGVQDYAHFYRFDHDEVHGQ